MILDINWHSPDGVETRRMIADQSTGKTDEETELFFPWEMLKNDPRVMRFLERIAKFPVIKSGRDNESGTAWFVLSNSIGVEISRGGDIWVNLPGLP